jgi:hypothetical protein
MALKVTSNKFKTWLQQDKGFHFSPDNLTLVPRASFQIDNNCPQAYRLIIAECINNGWIKPVAYQPIEEHFIEQLSQ